MASEVGANILKQGGNAVDAAIATQLALAVVYPNAGNIGGGGFLVARLKDNKTIALDYREKAPLSASPRHVSRQLRCANTCKKVYAELPVTECQVPLPEFLKA